MKQIIQANIMSISDIKEQALKLGYCIVTYKTRNYGWTARACKGIPTDGELTFDIGRFSYMPFAKTEIFAAIKAYVYILESIATDEINSGLS